MHGTRAGSAPCAGAAACRVVACFVLHFGIALWFESGLLLCRHAHLVQHMLGAHHEVLVHSAPAFCDCTSQQAEFSVSFQQGELCADAPLQHNWQGQTRVAALNSALSILAMCHQSGYCLAMVCLPMCADTVFEVVHQAAAAEDNLQYCRRAKSCTMFQGFMWSSCALSCPASLLAQLIGSQALMWFNCGCLGLELQAWAQPLLMSQTQLRLLLLLYVAADGCTKMYDGCMGTTHWRGVVSCGV